MLGNYDITSNTASFTITKATLTVTADNKTKLLNAANPPFTASYGGFVNGDSASAVTGTPSLVTTAVTNSPVGSIRLQRVRDADCAQLHVRFRQGHPESPLRVGRVTSSPINDTAHHLGT